MLDEYATRYGVVQSDISGEVRDDMDRLLAGALGWVIGNMGYLDPASAEVPTRTPKVKAILELAQFCQIWARLRPDDDRINEIAAFVRKIWQSPEFPGMVAAKPSLARQYGLIYGGLAPAGITSGFHKAVLADLAAEGYLAPRGKDSYLRAETRYYADLAGVGHQIESYPELYASSLLAQRATALPITRHDAYTITHTVFYLTHFGLRDPGLVRDDRERAHRIVCELTDYHVQHDEWELAGEFTLAQFCLGGDPARTSSGVAAIRQVRHVQLPGGAIPGRSIELRAEEFAAPVDFFRKSYHPTLVAAMMSLIISSAPRNS
jgi:hypothetical protein